MASAIRRGMTTFQNVLKTVAAPPLEGPHSHGQSPSHLRPLTSPAGGGFALSRVSLSAVQVQSGVSLMVVVEQKWRPARSGFFLFLRM